MPPWSDAAPVPGTALDGPGRAARGAGNWFTASFTALVRADIAPVEVIQRKTIVATADGVAQIVASVNVPRHPDALDRPVGLESELLYGGSLELRQQPYDSYFANVIVLPRPLALARATSTPSGCGYPPASGSPRISCTFRSPAVIISSCGYGSARSGRHGPYGCCATRRRP